MLAASLDYPSLRDKMHELRSTVPFFNIILDTIEKGLRTHTYRLRTQILSKIFPIKQTAYKKCSIIDCETSVSHLASMLFEKSPSLEEVSSCNKSCPPRQKQLIIIQIESDVLSNAELFKDVIKLHVMLPGGIQCCKKNCNGIEESEISLPGISVLFDVYNCQIKLKDIPSEFISPQNEKYKLIGLVDYTGPSIQTKLSNTSIGHFTALVFRFGNWIRYDDMTAHNILIQKTNEVQPHLVLYTKYIH